MCRAAVGGGDAVRGAAAELAPLLLELRARGVQVAALTHAAGLSAIGDPAI